MNGTRTVRLGDVVTFTNGGTPSKSKPEYWDGSIPWISGADISDSGEVKNRLTITELGLKHSSTNLITPDSLLLVTRTSVGKIGIIKEPTAISQDITGINPNSELDINFLRHFLIENREYLKLQSRGATIKGVTRNVVAGLKINLPPLEEQKRRAQIKDIQELIEQKRERQQELLKEFQIALFHKMFSGKDWPMKPLGEVATVVSGATPKTSKEEFWGGEIQWVTPAELSKLDSIYIDRTERTITTEGLDSCAAQVLPAGSVLLSSRAPIGLVAINTVPMATNQGFKSLIPGPELDSMYLYFWLKINTPYLQSLGVGATFKELSKSTLSKIKLPIPPKTLQQEFSQAI